MLWSIEPSVRAQDAVKEISPPTEPPPLVSHICLKPTATTISESTDDLAPTYGFLSIIADCLTSGAIARVTFKAEAGPSRIGINK